LVPVLIIDIDIQGARCCFHTLFRAAISARFTYQLPKTQAWSQRTSKFQSHFIQIPDDSFRKLVFIVSFRFGVYFIAFYSAKLV